MFKVNVNGNEYKVRFKHYFKSRTDKNGFIQSSPEKTTCIVSLMEAKISEGTAKPIKEMVEIVPSVTFAENMWGRRLKKTYKLDGASTGVVAVCKGDQFTYKDGRKYSFEKAITLFDRDTRTAFWKAFNKMGSKDKVDIVKVVQPDLAEATPASPAVG